LTRLFHEIFLQEAKSFTLWAAAFTHWRRYQGLAVPNSGALEYLAEEQMRLVKSTTTCKAGG